MNPSDSRSGPLRFRFLIRSGRWPPHLPGRVSSTGQSIFKNMPTLLPRESMDATSVIPASIQRPSPSDHRVGFSSSFTRLLMGSLALRPALLLFGNSRPRVATTPLPHATGAYGQLPRRDFNPLDLLLLLRTVRHDIVLGGHHRALFLGGCSSFLGPVPTIKRTHCSVLKDVIACIQFRASGARHGSPKRQRS